MKVAGSAYGNSSLPATGAEVPAFQLASKLIITKLREPVVVLFLAALAVRLSTLFVTGIDFAGWYGDTYHRWQISVYSLRIGFSHGRMWDLLGLEYFWGILPLLAESFLLFVFNTISLAPFRIFNAIVGSVNVIVLYYVVKNFIGRSHFRSASLLAALLVAFSPVIVMTDISGLAEPLAFFFLFFSLLFFRRRPYFFGVLLGLASMSRIEFWPVSWGLIACYMVFRRSGVSLLASLTGWLTPMTPYMLHLAWATGDFIYPFRLNITSDIAGAWITGSGGHPLEIYWRALFTVILITASAGLLLLVKKKPRNYILYALILGQLLIHGVTFGVSAYSRGFQPIYAVDRLIAVEYIFLAVLIAFAVNRMYGRNLKLGRVGVLLILLPIVALYSWSANYSFREYAQINSVTDTEFFVLAQKVKELYDGGTIVSNSVHLNYKLINLGVPPERILSSLYIPTDSKEEALLWLKKENVSLVMYLGRGDRIMQVFPELSGESPGQLFKVLYRHPTSDKAIYSVDSSALS